LYDHCYFARPRWSRKFRPILADEDNFARVFCRRPARRLSIWFQAECSRSTGIIDDTLTTLPGGADHRSNESRGPNGFYSISPCGAGGGSSRMAHHLIRQPLISARLVGFCLV